MAYDLRPERVEVSVGDLTIDVSRIASYPLWVQGVRLAAAWAAAKTDERNVEALGECYAYFLAEAQPTWQIVDHRGPVLPTLGGMYRLRPELGMGLYAEWLDTIREKATAVDEIVPPSQLRDQLNAKLRAKRRKAA